jgi:hypothetical protein
MRDWMPKPREWIATILGGLVVAIISGLASDIPILVIGSLGIIMQILVFIVGAITIYMLTTGRRALSNQLKTVGDSRHEAEWLLDVENQRLMSGETRIPVHSVNHDGVIWDSAGIYVGGGISAGGPYCPHDHMRLFYRQKSATKGSDLADNQRVGQGAGELYCKLCSRTFTFPRKND